MCYALPCMWIWRRCLRCSVGVCSPAFRLFWISFVLYQLLVFAFQFISLLVLASSNDDLRIPALGAIDAITGALNGWSQTASQYSSDPETWLLMRLALSVVMILLSLLTVFFSTLRVVVIPAGLMGGKLNSGVYQSSASAWTSAATQFILMIPTAAMNMAWYAAGAIESFIAKHLLYGALTDEPVRVVLSHVLTSLVIFLSMGLIQTLWSHVVATPPAAAVRRPRHGHDSSDDSDSEDERTKRHYYRRSDRYRHHSKHRAHSTDAGIRSRHHRRQRSDDESTITADDAPKGAQQRQEED